MFVFRGRARRIAIISIFAAVYLVLRIIPTFPMIGVPGAAFSMSDIIAPLYGIIFGPFLGAASIILGTLLPNLIGLKPAVFLYLDFLPATVNAITLGSLVTGRWLRAVVIYVILLILFLLHPFTSILIRIQIPGVSGPLYLPFVWLHLVGLLLLLSPFSRRAAKQATKAGIARLGLAVFMLSLIGTMSQHLTGNLLYETILGNVLGVITPEAYKRFWPVIFWIYPIERIFIVVIATLIGSPLIRVLKNSRILEPAVV